MDTFGRERSITLLLFVALITAVAFSFSIVPAFANTGNFTATAEIGNAVPTVVVDAGQAWLGAAGTSTTIQVFFNVSDTNGIDDINYSIASAIISQGATSRASSSCLNTTVNANTLRFNCSVTLWYYDPPAGYVINASIQDNQGNYTENATVNGSVSNLDAVTTTVSTLSFTASVGTTNTAANENPQRLNNTGNQDYTSINITGFNFADGSNFLGVGNVTFNVSAAGAGDGQALVNNSRIAIEAATLSRGAGNNQSLYFWLDVPTGTASGSYTSQADWELIAIQ